MVIQLIPHVTPVTLVLDAIASPQEASEPVGLKASSIQGILKAFSGLQSRGFHHVASVSNHCHSSNIHT